MSWLKALRTPDALYIGRPMTPPTLKRLYKEHRGKVSDRWSSYLREYDRLLREYRDKPIRLLEIGVQNGGSLELWLAFFPNARRVVGCDVNRDCATLKFDDQRIAVVIGDATMEGVRREVLEHAPFDIIIDDGSHRSGDIVKAFSEYFPFLQDGGIFIAEDLHCSYWQEFDGGLFDPLSSVAFFKRLADVTNREHWGVPKLASQLLGSFFDAYECEIEDTQLDHVHSVEFLNSICAVRKERPELNKVGTRFVAGSVALVVPGHWEIHSTGTYNLDQSRNKFANDDTRSEKIRQLLKKRMTTLRRRVSAWRQ